MEDAKVARRAPVDEGDGGSESTSVTASPVPVPASPPRGASAAAKTPASSPPARERSYSGRSPSVKRIMRELRELEAETSNEFSAEPLESDIFEWMFAVRGPKGTDFEGGIYLGRISLPADYPFKPPTFMLLTPSGRWEVNTKICLSISSHHPEHWQPSWSVRTALVAMIAFMPTAGEGALGSLDYPPEDRQDLARRSVRGPPSFSDPERDAVAKRLFNALLETAEADGGRGGGDGAAEAPEHQRAASPERSAAPGDGDGGDSGCGGAEVGTPAAAPAKERVKAACSSAGATQQPQQRQTDVIDFCLQLLIYSVGVALVAVIAKRFLFPYV